MPARTAAILPGRPPDKLGSSDGTSGTAGAPVSNTDACDWLAILRARYGKFLWAAGGADPFASVARLPFEPGKYISLYGSAIGVVLDKFGAVGPRDSGPDGDAPSAGVITLF